MAEPIAPDPFWNWQEGCALKAVYVDAARGSVEAQAQLAETALGMTIAKAVDCKDGLATAIFWARVAVAHGRASDQLALAKLLHLWAALLFDEGNEQGSVMTQVEVIVILDRLADSGDDAAAETLSAHSSLLSKDAFTIARQTQRAIDAAKGEEARWQ